MQITRKTALPIIRLYFQDYCSIEEYSNDFINQLVIGSVETEKQANIFVTDSKICFYRNIIPLTKESVKEACKETWKYLEI